MKLEKLILIFVSTMAVTFLCFLLFPVFALTRFGATTEPQSILLLRLVGALFGGLGGMAWAVRKSGARHSTTCSLAAVNALACLATLSAAVSGAFNAFAWIPVICFALLSFAFSLAASPAAPDHS